MTDRTPDQPDHGDPRHGSEDETRPLPEGRGEQHRYPAGDPGEPSYERTSENVGGFGFAPHDEHRERRRGRSGVGAGVVAALLVGALVVGGIAGVLGAAGFQAVGSDGGGDTATGSRTSSSPVVSRKDSTAADGSVEAVAKRVLPSVVKINVGNGQEQGSGSGIVISSDGEILTNNHVASVAGQGGRISVNFNDGSAKKATVVGTDPMTDLAVIKAEDVSGLEPATIGDSDKISVGENVVAIGSPFGLEATVTSGIVSATNRPVSVASEGSPSGQPSGQDTTYPAIQTDAAINPGNSGGPLVDLQGDVVGINSSIRTASDGSLGGSGQGGSIGLGFAIPISKVWPIVQQLRDGDTPTHAQMGVSVTDATSQSGLLTGAGVEDVTAGSPAQDAGLEKGDVITKVDGEVITGSESLVATVRGHRPGDEVALTVVRDGKTRTVDVTLESDGGASSS